MICLSTKGMGTSQRAQVRCLTPGCSGMDVRNATTSCVPDVVQAPGVAPNGAGGCAVCRCTRTYVWGLKAQRRMRPIHPTHPSGPQGQPTSHSLPHAAQNSVRTLLLSTEPAATRAGGALRCTLRSILPQSWDKLCDAMQPLLQDSGRYDAVEDVQVCADGLASVFSYVPRGPTCTPPPKTDGNRLADRLSPSGNVPLGRGMRGEGGGGGGETTDRMCWGQGIPFAS